MKKILLIYISMLFLFSCQTKNISNLDYKDTKSYMYGMVYDFDNKPVGDAKIYINNNLITKTDIQGRFILNIKKSKDLYSITVKKETYESLSSSFSYDPMNVLYFKLINTNQLLKQAEYYLSINSYESAIKFLQRATNLSPDRNDIKFLECIILYKKENYQAAFKKIKELQYLEPNNEFIKKFSKQLEEHIKPLD